MSDRMNRQDRDRKKKSLLKYLIIILAAFFVIGLIYKVGQNISTLHNRNSIETTVARYGCLHDKLQGEGLVLFKEKVISAPANGFFENLVAEREKVARSTQVGYYINSGNKTIMQAPEAGIFTRQIDGLEAALSEINLPAVGPEVFKYKKVSANPANEIKKNQGVYKIVDNLVPSRLLLHFPMQSLNLKIAEQQKAELIVNGKSTGMFEIKAYKMESKELIMLIENDEFLEELLNNRLVKAELRMNSVNGCLIPKKSIVKKGKERGIYCTKGEDILFKAVKVLDQKDDTAVVEGLEATDLVIINPEVLAHNV